MPSSDPLITESERARGFLQSRVRSYGLFSAAINGAFIAYRFALAVALRDTGELNTSVLLQAAAGLAWLAVYGLCTRAVLAAETLRALETSCFLVCAGLYAWMSTDVSAVGRPDLQLSLTLVLALVSRCIYVPSTPQRTLVIAALLALPLVAASYLVFHRVTEPALRVWHGVYHELMHERAHRNLDAESLAWTYASNAAMLWLACSAISVATSQVVHGLRREVDDIRRLGQYVLEEQLGRGGMGVVYRASHALLRRPTAIKLLRPGRTGALDIERFEREVRLTASLRHPNTITVFDYGRTPEGVFYYAMELLDGATLEDIVRLDGPQPVGRVIGILSAVAGALTEAHAAGLIHRDIKPANIMLCDQGGIADTVKVLDFGLVKEVQRLDAGARVNSASDPIVGTPLYLSPEAILTPDAVDARSDLYALGAVGYYLLAGAHIFEGKSIVEVCAHHLHSVPSPPSERIGRQVDPELEALLMRCLAKDPNDRPVSSAALNEALRACAAGDWSAEHARSWWEKNAAALRERRFKAQALRGGTIGVDWRGRGIDSTSRASVAPPAAPDDVSSA